MIFCEKCGALLVPTKEDRKVTLTCNSCGFVSTKKGSIIVKEEGQKNNLVEVVDKKIETLPKIEEECPKCENKKAYYWTVQTRAGDEAETRFFKCVKCDHTWREYD